MLKKGAFKGKCDFMKMHASPPLLSDRTQEIAVIVGELNMQSSDLYKKRIMADAFYSHENYTNNGEELINDISLVHLSTSIEYNERVQPIRLPASDIGSLDGDKVVMSGWGRTSTHGDTSPVLRFVESIAIPNKICQLAYLAFGKIRDSNLCVSGWFMKGTCLGDSGGPLAIIEDDGKPTLVGIISFVLKYSCNLSFPPVFTRVSSFVPWILTAIEDMKRGRNAKSRAVRLLL
ncbi:Chymotrypsin-1 [Frankliniella fusca]|uniref:Chymotrypsin-1 n=1 Tax=Frankliniella fusca TaxID=407009 RepID=A0AAE1H3V0_9NEOP|nr:Chymotrypsin-1 [Frankliniella fusca]